ncbi:MAG: sensor histidine kinase [Micropruina sp.]|uniref:sensor histidine kinase n=1 Tax=Micropruina sp. TaxID=2737536 RepID=UPI0039E2D867
MTDKTALQAPAFAPGACDLPWYRRALAQGAGYILPSCVFAFIPIVYALDAAPAVIALVALNCLAIVVFFAGSTLVMHWPEYARWLWLLGLIGSIVLLAVFPDSRPIYFAPFITCTSVTLIAWRHALVVVIATTLVGLGIAVLQGDLFGVVMVLMGLALALTVGLGIRYDATRAALREAEERTAVLAVAAERERIGRDLHDILGHSLTTIAVKADLAQRLAERDPAAASAQIGEIAAIARQSLKDVRATAAGMREVRLASEIAAARSVLTAAGIECRAPVALPVIGDADSELLGYAVREAVTNVVRHSGATRCTIEADAAGVTITDDGTGFGEPHEGSGLTGLRERAERAGGGFTLHTTNHGTVLSVRLPVPAPAPEGSNR